MNFLYPAIGHEMDIKERMTVINSSSNAMMMVIMMMIIFEATPGAQPLD